MDIVDSLNKEEIRSFKLYLKRSMLKLDDAPVSMLFESYRDKALKNDQDIYETIFPKLKKNAFYRLKNRMIEDIYKSLLLINFDKNEEILTRNSIILSDIFTFKSEFKIAYRLLCKAAQKAIKNEFYSLLEIIYDKMIALARQNSEVPVMELIKKKNDVIKEKQKDSKINDLIAELNYKLRQSNFQLKDKNILESLDEVKNQLENSHLLETSARVKFMVQNNISYILLSSGEYHSLDVYLRTEYKKHEESKIFTKSNYRHKIIMLVWLSNANLKLLRFDIAINYAEQLRKSLEDHKKLYYNNFIWAYYQTLFIASYYKGDLDDCLELLESLTQQISAKNNIVYFTFVNLNLVIVNYSLKNIKQASRYINNLLAPDTFKQLSADLKLDIIIIDLILYFDNGDCQYLLYTIKNIKRKFNHILKLPTYKYQKDFINLLELACKSNDKLSNPIFIKRVSEFIKNAPKFEAGKNEALDYKVWWQAKTNKQTYFNQLMRQVEDMRQNLN